MGHTKNEQKTNKSPVMTADQHTRLSWARLITSFTQLPEKYQVACPFLQRSTSDFPYCVLTPTYAGFLTRGVEQLVIFQDQQLVVVDVQRERPFLQTFHFNDIFLMEFQSVLLDSYFNIHGTDQSGQVSTLSIHFNSVTDYLFFPILKAIRENGKPRSGIADPAYFEELSFQSFKFANYARKSLLPGEPLLKMVWQPESRVNRFKRWIPVLFRSKHWHDGFPNHLVLLSDRELILIHEIERQPSNSHYGGLWQFIPLNKIESVSLEEQANDLICLVLNLRGNKTLTSLYGLSQKEALMELEKVIQINHAAKKAKNRG